MEQEFLIKNIIDKSYNKLFLIADIHLGVRNNSLEWIDNIKNYFYNFLSPTLKNNISTNDNPCLIVLGDVFDNRQTMDINVMNIAFDLFIDISKILNIIILTGNHDIYKKINNDINSLRFLKTINNITVIEKPTILRLNNDLMKKPLNIGIIPWLGYHKIESSYISENDIDYAMMHTDITGLTFDNGRVIYSGVTTNLFKGKKIFSGHIHKRQESKRIIYVGSPYQLRRSDIGNDKGIYEFDVINETLKFHKNDYSPKFLRIKLEDILDYNLDKVQNIFNNNYIYIIISNKYVKQFNTSKLLNVLQNCNYKKIEFVVDKNDDQQVNINENIIITDNLSEQLISEIKGLDISDKNKDLLIKLNEYYLNNAKLELNNEN